MSLRKSLNHAFLPVSISLQIFGLQLLYINKRNELHVSYWRIGVTIFYLVTTIVSTHYSNFIDVGNEERINGSKVIKVILLMYTPGSMFLMLVTYIYNFIRIKKDKSLVSEIFNIIELLESLEMNEAVKDAIKNIFRYNLKMVLLVISGDIIFDISFDEFLHGPKYGYLTILIVNWPFFVERAVMVNNQILIVSWLVLIQKMFEIIIIASNKILESSLQNDTTLSNSVNALLEVYNKLRKCVDTFGELYSFQLFIFIVFNYLSILSYAYLILNYIVFGIHTNDKYITFTFILKSIVYSIFHLIFITTHVVAIINQVSK